MKYKSNSRFENGSSLTDRVCDLIEWAYIGALKTAKRGDKIYVRATLLKPNEIRSFQDLNGMQLDGCIIKTMNFNR